MLAAFGLWCLPRDKSAGTIIMVGCFAAAVLWGVGTYAMLRTDLGYLVSIGACFAVGFLVSLVESAINAAKLRRLVSAYREQFGETPPGVNSDAEQVAGFVVGEITGVPGPIVDGVIGSAKDKWNRLGLTPEQEALYERIAELQKSNPMEASKFLLVGLLGSAMFVWFYKIVTG